MARLPPNSTARLFVDYITATTAGTEHTLMVRYTGADRAAAAAQQRVLDLLTGLGANSFRSGWKVLRVRTALALEDFTLTQTPLAGLSSFVGSSTAGTSPLNETRSWSYVYRSLSSARRGALFLYGMSSGLVGNELRVSISGASPSPWAGGLSALNAASSPLRAIDGSNILWYSYVNFSHNSYWERRKRLG